MQFCAFLKIVQYIFNIFLLPLAGVVLRRIYVLRLVEYSNSRIVVNRLQHGYSSDIKPVNNLIKKIGIIVHIRGHNFYMTINEHSRIKQLKEELSRKGKIDISAMRLIYNGEILEEQFTVHDYRIKTNSTIHVIIAMIGGMDTSEDESGLLSAEDDGTEEKNKKIKKKSNECSRVGITKIAFIRSKPSIWFRKLENHFDAVQIRGSKRKFNEAYNNLPDDILLDLPDDLSEYEELKKHVLSYFQKSDSEKVREALEQCSFEGKRPSQYVSSAKTKLKEAGLQFDEKLMKFRLDSALPSELKLHMAAHKDKSLEDYVVIADSIYDIYNENKKINLIKNEKINSEEKDIKPKNRNYYDTIPFKENQRTVICRAHIYYGEKARFCKPWCRWPGTKPNILPSSRTNSAVKRNYSKKRISYSVKTSDQSNEKDKVLSKQKQQKNKDNEVIEKYNVSNMNLKKGQNTNNILFYIEVKINEKCNPVKMLVDTGSEVTIIPESHAGNINEARIKLTAANGSKVDILGQTEADIVIKGLRRIYKWKCVASNATQPILGADFLKACGLTVDMKNFRLYDKLTNLGVQCIINEGEYINAHIKMEINETKIENEDIKKRLLQNFKELSEPWTPNQEVKHGTKHFIETVGAPLYSKPRVLVGEKLDAVKEEFKKLQEMGIVRVSKSPWASPIHLVPKGEGWRIVGDYRRLNNVSKDDAYPMQNINSLTAFLHGSKVFTKLDLMRGYNQIPMDENSIEKTAVCTPIGLFEYLRMPFGLKNASNTFQRFMDQILSDCNFVFAYIDDVLIFSKTEEEHSNHVNKVLKILSENGLKLNVEKSLFFQKEITFLGFDINDHGIKPEKKKCIAIQNIPQPDTVRKLMSFLGLANFYRKYIKNFSCLSNELYELIKNKKLNDKINFESNHTELFDKIKSSLLEVIEYSFINPKSNIYTITTDASKSAIGGVLHQVVDECSNIIQCFSRKLKDAETRYSTFDRELLAIYEAVKYFKPFVDGQNVTVFTDHKSLCSAFKKKSECKSDRQSRHFSYISEYVQDIQYLKGEDNIVADYLSREIEVNSIQLEPFDESMIKKAQENSTELKNDEIRSKLNKIDGIWCDCSLKIRRPFVPEEIREVITKKFHEIGHWGKKKTLQLMTERYFWPKMNSDIGEIVECCLICQQQKVGRHTKSKLEQLQHPTSRFAMVHIDIVGPLPVSRNSERTNMSYKYLLTCIDRFSRWIEAIPLSTITTEEIAEALVNGWISRFGVPLEIITDRGRQFEADLFNKLSKLCGFIRLRTTSYHPQSNGMIERQHRTLKQMLRTKEDDWLTVLPIALLAMRIMPNKDGISAAELVMGTKLKIPGAIVEDKINKITDENIKDYCDDLKKLMQEIQIPYPSWNRDVNEYIPKDMVKCKKVWVRVDRVRNSLEAPYEGPFEVVKKYKKYFIILKNGKEESVSIDRLKPVKMRYLSNNEKDKDMNRFREIHEDSDEEDEMIDEIINVEEEFDKILEKATSEERPYNLRPRKDKVTFNEKRNTVRLIPREGKGRKVIR